MGKKAQVSLEILLAIAVVLITLVLVYTTTTIRNNQTELLKQTYEYGIQCNKIALTISNVYSAGRGGKILFAIDNDAFVGDNNVTITDDDDIVAYCEFPAKAEPGQLSKGTVEAKNVAGTVVLSNA